MEFLNGLFGKTPFSYFSVGALSGIIVRALLPFARLRFTKETFMKNDDVRIVAKNLLEAE